MNAILELVHQTIMAMLHISEMDMAETVTESDIADFLTNAAWAVCSTYHAVLKTSLGAAIFGRDMLFGITFLADWKKYGNVDKNKLIRTHLMKIKDIKTENIKPVIKYL